MIELCKVCVSLICTVADKFIVDLWQYPANISIKSAYQFVIHDITNSYL